MNQQWYNLPLDIKNSFVNLEFSISAPNLQHPFLNEPPLFLHTYSLSLFLCVLVSFLSSFNCLSFWLSPFLSKIVYNFQAFSFSFSPTHVTSFAPLVTAKTHRVHYCCNGNGVFLQPEFCFVPILTSPFNFAFKKNWSEEQNKNHWNWTSTERKGQGFDFFQDGQIWVLTHTHTSRDSCKSRWKKKGHKMLSKALLSIIW